MSESKAKRMAQLNALCVTIRARANMAASS